MSTPISPADANEVISHRDAEALLKRVKTDVLTSIFRHCDRERVKLPLVFPNAFTLDGSGAAESDCCVGMGILFDQDWAQSVSDLVIYTNVDTDDLNAYCILLENLDVVTLVFILSELEEGLYDHVVDIHAHFSSENDV